MKIIKPANLLYTIALIALFTLSAAFAQEEPQDTIPAPPPAAPAKPDTVCFKFGFQPKDTLFYRVGGMDSIIYDYEPALTKVRYSRIMLICDSVRDGKMYMTQSLVTFTSTENKSYIKGVKRDDTPWLNRKVHFVIDSVGTRYNWWVDDSTNAALTPGGAFEPVLIFPFKESCKAVDESWIESSKDYYPENGVPVSVVQQSTLFRAMAEVDTLGERCSRMRFVRTGQGAVYIVDERVKMAVTSVLNSSGMITISKEKQVPMHYFSTVEQKLKIKAPDKADRPAWQYTNVDYVLEELRRHPATTESAATPVNRPAKKKKSKR